jgi:hypothetical protein
LSTLVTPSKQGVNCYFLCGLLKFKILIKIKGRVLKKVCPSSHVLT